MTGSSRSTTTSSSSSPTISRTIRGCWPGRRNWPQDGYDDEFEDSLEDLINRIQVFSD